MNKIRLSAIAISISLALTGCGGDSGGDNTAPVSTTTQNKFIDAAVEGLAFTTSSGGSGVTGSDGSFSLTKGDTVTFYLGGKDGVKMGAAADRAILTPFEAVGKFDRALNLAILLQSLDGKFGSSGDDVLTIPNKLRSMDDSAAVTALSNLQLDDRTSVETFLTAVGVTSIVSEDDALAHMKASLTNLDRGEAVTASQFAQGSGNIIRSIDINQTIFTAADSSLLKLVHADKTLPTALFNETRGMTVMDFRLEQDDIVVLAGANDGRLTQGYATNYLSCLAEGGIASSSDYSICTETISQATADKYTLSGYFSYDLINPSSAELESTEAWSDKWLPLGTTNSADLNSYSEVIEDDSDAQDGSDWQRVVSANSYDPVTKIYTEVSSQTKLTGTNCDTTTCTDVRTSNGVTYYYEISSASTDRYVDFTGNWSATEICDDNTIAVMNYTFDTVGITTTGTECVNNTAQTIPEETHGYETLAKLDFWWFNQTGRSSKATLTELNSLVRYCDDTSYVAGTVCGAQEQFVKWEYQPAGANWDQGLLIRTKMNPSGGVDGTMTLQKI